MPDRQQRLRLRRIIKRPMSSMNLYKTDEHVVNVQNLSFLRAQPAGVVFVVEFFAGWCGHCQAFAPIWRLLGALSCAAGNLRVGAVDCVAHAPACRSAQVTGYPTIRLFGQELPPQGFPLTRARVADGEAMLRIVLTQPVARKAAGMDADEAARRSRARGCRHSKGPSLRAAARAGLREAGLLPGQEPKEARQWPLPMVDLGSALLYSLQHEIPKTALGPVGGPRHRVRTLGPNPSRGWRRSLGYLLLAYLLLACLLLSATMFVMLPIFDLLRRRSYGWVCSASSSLTQQVVMRCVRWVVACHT